MKRTKTTNQHMKESSNDFSVLQAKMIYAETLFKRHVEAGKVEPDGWMTIDCEDGLVYIVYQGKCIKTVDRREFFANVKDKMKEGMTDGQE